MDQQEFARMVAGDSIWYTGSERKEIVKGVFISREDRDAVEIEREKHNVEM